MGLFDIPVIQRETLGAKLRRLARQASNNNAWSRPQMRAVGPWQPSSAVTVSAMCVNGGNLYVCGVGGTTASSGGPTATNGQAVTDGTAKWYYFGPNQVTQDPVTATPPWAGSTAITLGQQRVSGSSVYACVSAGTTAASGGPTGTGSTIVDGTTVWTYMGPTYANPQANDFPTYTYGAAAPAAQTNIHGWYGSGSGNASNKFTATSAHSIVSGGSGYVVGEIITLTGGTFTTAAQYTVTAVSGGVITSVNLSNPGVYSQLPATLPVAQGSSSGSGTGATFYAHFSQPTWCRIRGAEPVRLQTGNWCVSGIVQMSPGVAETYNALGMEFMSDSQAVTWRLQTSAGANMVVIVDGVRYNLAPLPDPPAGASNNNFYTLTFPTRKTRRWKLEQYTSVGFALPPIYVDSNSSVWAPPDQDVIRGAFIGDSLTVGASSGPFVAGNHVAFGVSHELGWADPWMLGVGTTGHVHEATPGLGNQFIYRIRRMTLLNPDIWVIMGSWNDNTESTAAVTAAVQAEIAAIRAAGSTAPIVYIGVWSANASTVAANEAAILAGITGSDPLNNTFWIPIYGDPFAPWVLGSWNNNPTPKGATMPGSTNANLYVDTPNSPHPSDIGTVYEWRRMAEAIRGYVLPNIK